MSDYGTGLAPVWLTTVSTFSRRLVAGGGGAGGGSMKSKILHDDGTRTFALVFETGDEAIQGLTSFAKAEHLTAGHFTAIGAFERLTLGYFDWSRKDYLRLEMAEQVEVLSLVGDVALDGGEPKVHAHVVVGKADGTAYGGHLLAARIRPTLEVILVEPPAYLRRRFDAESRLALIDLEDRPADTRRDVRGAL